MNCGKDFFVGKECHTRLWNGGNLTPSRQESHSVSIGRYGSNFDQFQLLCSFQRITKELLNFSQVSLEGGRVFMKQELVLKLPMQHCVRSACQNLPFDNETVLDLWLTNCGSVKTLWKSSSSHLHDIATMLRKGKERYKDMNIPSVMLNGVRYLLYDTLFLKIH